jgi:hypothetical protein
MLHVCLPGLRVLGRQGFVTDEEVLGILLLGRLRKVKAPRDDDLVIDDHDLVMGDGVVRIEHGLDALVRQEVGRGALLRALTLIEDDLHLDATFVGVKQRFGDRRRGEGIGLDQNAPLGIAQSLDDQVGAIISGCEADGHSRWHGRGARQWGKLRWSGSW